MSSLTPMMQQYMEIKEQYKDCILMYRLGDFYEMFFEDAITASGELELTLTGRDCGQDERAPMCGVPYHSVDGYLNKLISKGYKVAICEQTEDASATKGIVKREVIRVVTPGTVMDETALDSAKNNYLCAVCKLKDTLGLAFADITTGELYATELTGDIYGQLISELSRFMPTEIILNSDAYTDKDIEAIITGRILSYYQKDDRGFFEPENSTKTILSQFKGKTLEELGLSANLCAAYSVGAIIAYINHTQKIYLAHLCTVSYYTTGQFMEIDISTRRNLELTETMRDKAKKGSLLWVMDKTVTSMGARLIRKWIEQPLVNCAAIQRRLAAVEELLLCTPIRGELREAFKAIKDIERLTGKIVYGSANGRDLAALAQSLATMPAIGFCLSRFRSTLLSAQHNDFDALTDVKELIDFAIVEIPPISLRDGGIIKDGYDEKLDSLRRAMVEGKGWLADVENSEREKTGIKNLKIGFNKVFGYYIEISKSHIGKVPDYYIRKQTLSTGERYITPKLKEIENIVLGAEERIVMLEYQIFCDIRDKVAAMHERLQKTARIIANLDVLCSLSEIAAKNNYCKPEVDVSDKLIIKDGRHPVVEKVLRDGLFVANDTELDNKQNRLAIITGPNMAGKSTYMRQVALITLMAQVGSYVPASSALIGITDKIFTRVGASDDLASGQSTFMVEMSEVANILKNATSSSLLILDEIGRGTSTYDGLAIAWAVIEYAADPSKIGAKTLFATHYHELTELENKLDGVKNYCVAVKKRGDDITFLRRISRGGADDSYGIEVAKLAGVPEGVIKRAKAILNQLEENDINRGSQVLAKGRAKKENNEDSNQLGFVSVVSSEIIEELTRLDLNILTPIEAMNVLYKLKAKL